MQIYCARGKAVHSVLQAVFVVVVGVRDIARVRRLVSTQSPPAPRRRSARGHCRPGHRRSPSADAPASHQGFLVSRTGQSCRSARTSGCMVGTIVRDLPAQRCISTPSTPRRHLGQRHVLLMCCTLCSVLPEGAIYSLVKTTYLYEHRERVQPLHGVPLCRLQACRAHAHLRCLAGGCFPEGAVGRDAGQLISLGSSIRSHDGLMDGTTAGA